MHQKKGKMDVTLLVVIIALMCIGTVMVFSASYQNDLMLKNNGYYTAIKQIQWLILGLIVMLTVANINFKMTLKYSNLIVFGAIFLLILVFFVGGVINGSRRWLGSGGLGIQPSELAKLAIIIYFAKKLANEKSTLKGIRGFMNLTMNYSVIPAIIFILIILEPNMSTACVILFIAFFMLLIAGLGMDIIMTFTTVGVAAGIGLIIIEPYRLDRVIYTFDPWKDMSGKGWQAIQSLYAVGSGGLFGMGLGQGRQKLGYLPMPNNDFIFSTTCEELGFIGAVFLISIFALLVYRMVKIALFAPDRYSCYIVCGVIAWIVIQVILHLLIAVSFFPVTGVPLPLISAGGSSALFISVAFGLVLNISRYSTNKTRI